jgi:hypothetical protein
LENREKLLLGMPAKAGGEDKEGYNEGLFE